MSIRPGSIKRFIIICKKENAEEIVKNSIILDLGMGMGKQ